MDEDRQEETSEPTPDRARHRREVKTQGRDGVIGGKSYLKALLVVKANQSAKKMLAFTAETVLIIVLLAVALFVIDRNGAEWAEKYQAPGNSTVSLPTVTVETPDESLVVPTLKEMPDNTSMYTWVPESASNSVTFLYPFDWEPIPEMKEGKTHVKEFVTPNQESLVVAYRPAKNPTVAGLEKLMIKQAKRWGGDTTETAQEDGKYHIVYTADSQWAERGLHRQAGGYITDAGYFTVTVISQQDAQKSSLGKDTALSVITSALIE